MGKEMEKEKKALLKQGEKPRTRGGCKVCSGKDLCRMGK